MSLYIPGMEMPTSCGKCNFHKPLYHTQFCIIAERNCAPHETRKDWCPLIEVPPHGRLVDADALEKQAVFSFDTDEDIIFMDDLHDAPTVIPADKEEP